MEPITLSYPIGFVPDRQYLINAQKSLYELKGCPLFAPADGFCFTCGRDCVTLKWESELITGCSKCGKSFCD